MGTHGPDGCAQGGVLTTERLRTFGRRQDKPLKPRQQRLMDDLLPQVVVTPETAAAAAAGHDGPVWFEVGFGGGEHLAWQAARNPGVLFIGAEPFVNGVAKLLTQIEEQGLRNVRIRHGDARDVMAALPDGRLSRLFVLHPDPWPKRRHHKRRIVNQDLLAEAHRLLAPGAELRVSSDIPDYVRWTLMQVRRQREGTGAGFAWTARRPGDWTERPDDWPQTRYEAKALREGRTPAYLRFERA